VPHDDEGVAPLLQGVLLGRQLDHQVEFAGGRLVGQAVDRARDLAKASKAHATRKAYAANLRDFAAYYQRIGTPALPAAPSAPLTGWRWSAR